VKFFSLPLAAMYPTAFLLCYHQKMRPPRVRRIGLLYAEYFGINGSLFTWKIIAL
jgi:hypothetical protein